MLKFKISEIPEGHSTKSVDLTGDDLQISDYTLKGMHLDIEFYRTLHFIKVNFDMKASLVLTCDRSLDDFDYDINQQYEVIFKAEEVEEEAGDNGAVRNINFTTNSVNLETDVRDTLLLNLPIKKLHPRFLNENGEPEEFIDEQYGSLKGESDAVDPRWEALKELKKDS